MMLYVLVPGLAIWMLFCAYAGYQRRFGLVLIVVAIGMVLNTFWMVFGLDAKPLSRPALMAHAAAVFYAISAVGTGFLIGRLVQAFRESKVNTHD
ncbi:hypothetical protein [uncultured Sulfitobacter sp.]|uniref:hypothetical protein n=1 Tax=uncultured Sulfitobacter sp. TaxID=191468 RepID=UPI0026316E0A|nr:hypothetical protein [uncultured Sulfitobacter sp.]